VNSNDLPRYDRDFLLSPAKRNQIVELWEVEKFGRDSFGDPDAVSLYGMTPAQWHARGVRILARTALEAVRDPLGKRIGEDVARVAATAPPGSVFGVVDPFAGSCNALFSILRHLPVLTEGLGFEFEQAIFDMTKRNIASLGSPIRLLHGDYRVLLGEHRFPPAHRIVAFLAPPWADALSAETGLDLSRTRACPQLPRSSIISSASTQLTQSSTLSKCTSVSCRSRSRRCAAGSNRRNSASTGSPALLDDTGFSLAPSAGTHKPESGTLTLLVAI